MAYFADNNTRNAALFVVWMMSACGNAAMVCQVPATCCNRSSRYARERDIAAVMDGQPEAGVLATYPSAFNTLRHDLGNAARPRFAVMRAQFVGPEACALVYHCSCDSDATSMSRCVRGVGFVIAFWYNAANIKNVRALLLRLCSPNVCF